jgi:Rieske 2Fe-2S family protein
VKSELEPTLRQAFYLSPRIHAIERERIFHREWFCAARSEHIPHPGDYLVRNVAGESIILVRRQDGAIGGHYNLCRHRGCRLFLDEETQGNCGNSLRCPYHAWTYNLDGSLRTAPYLGPERAFYRDEFPLYEVGVDTWGGFVFVNLSPGEARARGQSLVAHLGPIPERVRRYPLADLRAGRRFVYDVAANWKVILENYNECYHCGGVHPELCAIVPAFKKDGGMHLDWERGIPHREGAFTFTFSGTTTRAPFPGLSEDEKVRHKGELIYPNFMLSLAADHVAAFTLWPRSAERTSIVCEILFHPEEMAKPDFDPSDAADFWDLVNRQDWAICEGVQRGMTSRRFRYGFYAPMESLSLDIRRYIEERLGTRDPWVFDPDARAD